MLLIDTVSPSALGTELKALCMLGKGSVTELYPHIAAMVIVCFMNQVGRKESCQIKEETNT